MEIIGQILLNDDLCERAVLGTILAYNDYYQTSDIPIVGDMFYNVKNLNLFLAMKPLLDANKTTDTVSVLRWTQTHPGKIFYSPVELLQLQGGLVTAAFGQNVERLSELMNRRRCHNIGLSISELSTDPSLDFDPTVQRATEALQGLSDTYKGDMLNIRDVASRSFESVKANAKLKKPNSIHSGFGFIDTYMKGLHQRDFNIIAADTSQGKTAFALALTLHAAESGSPVAFYSMEMTSIELFARFESCLSGVPVSTILYAPLNGQQMRAYEASKKKLENLPIYFDDKASLSFERIISSLRKMVRMHGVKLVFIDYIQILSSVQKNDNENQFMGYIARTLKNLAKELDICIFALSQLSRRSGKNDDDQEPTLRRVRASGQIAEAADNVFLIYRPEVYGKSYSGAFASIDTHNTAQISIPKGRNTGVGQALAGFIPERTLFYDIDKGPPEIVDGAGQEQDITF